MVPKKILVTGAAGFIGFHLCKRLIDSGFQIVGLDNINDYYDIDLKLDRLEQLGIGKDQAKEEGELTNSIHYKNFSFIRMNLEDRKELPKLFVKENFKLVCNLAAQAGVRYSLENPEAYIDSNLVGFANLLECCRNYETKHLVYASSSSVYGQNQKVPFSEGDNVDHPISLYAATKKSNELMAYTYSHLYNFKTTGLRFFTVYGPWGRPDMAMNLFTNAIIKGSPIKIFNYGELERDFTYIDDIINGIYKVLNKIPNSNYKIYNIGNSKPVRLLSFVKEIENQLGIEAKKDMLPMQPGDVYKTWADIDSLREDYEYNTTIGVKEGINSFVKWYREYYNIK
ncbi:NAD-dependent epimerase/dehydratase family protein [Gramella aestuarii]|uniref:NAD-dependent epimerase/dehydratase family protein n=1 Tax=Christiangramia aestuarii TaxID=1028746 RepID=A0A7M3SWU0_9FLAO|nr:NAD-dependent epimerase/dehydratase family protein [Christiangramia aestuarii]